MHRFNGGFAIEWNPQKSRHAVHAGGGVGQQRGKIHGQDPNAGPPRQLVPHPVELRGVRIKKLLMVEFRAPPALPLQHRAL